MKKLIQLLLVSCVLILSTVVFAGAKQSPESIVTCAAGNGDVILIADVSVPLNMGLCEPFVDTCAPCVTSLENQGCKFIDVVVTHLVQDVLVGDGIIVGKTLSNASYLLSCDGR
jgi:hypothetical protein